MRMNRLAWLAANVMSPHVKGRISPQKLLGRSTSVPRMPKAELKAQMSAAAKDNG